MSEQGDFGVWKTNLIISAPEIWDTRFVNREALLVKQHRSKSQLASGRCLEIIFDTERNGEAEADK